jgi:hypothetical protein
LDLFFTGLISSNESSLEERKEIIMVFCEDARVGVVAGCLNEEAFSCSKEDAWTTAPRGKESKRARRILFILNNVLRVCIVVLSKRKRV